MKIGDLVMQADKSVTVPKGAIGLVVDEDNSQPTTPRWTIHWFHNNILRDLGLPICETVGYGYGIEVVCESR